jgi:hypothetical protein
VAGIIRLINMDMSEDPTPFSTTRLLGQYTWKMDPASSGKHTLHFYRMLTSDRTSILIQARTGHYRLNQYLSQIGVVEEDVVVETMRRRLGIPPTRVRGGQKSVGSCAGP